MSEMADTPSLLLFTLCTTVSIQKTNEDDNDDEASLGYRLNCLRPLALF